MEVVDLETWPRRAHFQFFSGLSFPFYNVTSTLDVTGFYPWVKERRLSFYYSLIYATMAVMNGLPDYLYKIRGEQVVKHDHLDPSFVVMDQSTHLLKILTVPFGGTLEEFCARCAIPRVTWGKFEQREGRLLLPYAVQLNHRLLDGWHLSQLVNGVQAWIDQR